MVKEYTVFYRTVGKEAMVMHVFVDAKDSEAALKAGEKAVGKKGVVFRADASPEWSVDK
jgi:hypothetical protein